MISLNENGSETNVATGFHALEFLLWGQDLSTTGPGARSYTDYVAGTGKNAERRAEAAEALPQPYDSLILAPEGSEERKIFPETIFSVVDAGTAVKEAAKSIGISLASN